MANTVVGIDLGTTNSLVAYMEDGSPRVIRGLDGSGLVPSVVTVNEGGDITVGQIAKAQRVMNAKNTIYSVKRLMGRGLEEMSGELKRFPWDVVSDSLEVIRVKLGNKVYTPPEISACILKELKRIAELHLREPITQAVITVPAYFNDSQRQATKDAGRLAGIEVLRTVNEPTAAALAYGIDQKKDGIVAVYDLGGGTFDMSILKLKGDIFEVIATCGDTHLGGDDIDERLAEMMISEVEAQTGQKMANNLVVLQLFREAAEQAKCRLSTQTSTQIHLDPGPWKYERILTRKAFEERIYDILAKTLGPCKQAVLDAGISKEEISAVLLVGGSTRIPLLQNMVGDFFGQMPRTDLNPDEAVALGAAIQANLLGSERAFPETLLIDVTPLSLGIETYGGAVSKLILRNSTIPTSATEAFTTFIDNQTKVSIHVLQGERELVKDCRSLGRFDLEVDPAPAGFPRIEVTFLLDANGILKVTAKDVRTGKTQSISVKPSYGLTDEEVEAMLMSAFEEAESDFKTHLLIDARNEADMIMRAVEKSLPKAGKLLTETEHDAVHQALSDLKSARSGDDHNIILDKVQRLNEATHKLAQLMMETTIAEALKDKKLADFL